MRILGCVLEVQLKIIYGQSEMAVPSQGAGWDAYIGCWMVWLSVLVESVSRLLYMVQGSKRALLSVLAGNHFDVWKLAPVLAGTCNAVCSV